MGNVLSDRFLDVDESAELVDAELERLTTALIDSGPAAELLAEHVDGWPTAAWSTRTCSRRRPG